LYKPDGSVAQTAHYGWANLQRHPDRPDTFPTLSMPEEPIWCGLWPAATPGREPPNGAAWCLHRTHRCRFARSEESWTCLSGEVHAAEACALPFRAAGTVRETAGCPLFATSLFAHPAAQLSEHESDGPRAPTCAECDCRLGWSARLAAVMLGSLTCAVIVRCRAELDDLSVATPAAGGQVTSRSA